MRVIIAFLMVIAAQAAHAQGVYVPQMEMNSVVQPVAKEALGTAPLDMEVLGAFGNTAVGKSPLSMAEQNKLEKHFLNCALPPGFTIADAPGSGGFINKTIRVIIEMDIEGRVIDLSLNRSSEDEAKFNKNFSTVVTRIGAGLRQCPPVEGMDTSKYEHWKKYLLTIERHSTAIDCC